MLEGHKSPQNDHSSLRKNTKYDIKLMCEKNVIFKKAIKKVALEMQEPVQGRHLQNQEKMGKDGAKKSVPPYRLPLQKSKTQKEKEHHT